MSRFNREHVPSYRLHKSSGKAVVTIGYRDHYLGVFDSASSREKYNRLISEWFAAGRSVAAIEAKRSDGDDDGPAVVEIIAVFWAHAQAYYRHRDGTPTGELTNFRQVLRALRRLYGDTPAAAFDLASLEACQADMIRAGLSRKNINRRIGRIKQVFKFAARKKLVPVAVHEELKLLGGLEAGRSDAKELPDVKAVEEGRVRAVITAAPSRVLATMIELQFITGMRSGELVTMRTGDIDRTDKTWVYAPRRHKNSFRGQPRTICLGDRAKKIIAPFLRLDPEAFIFSPADAERERKAALTASRKTPLSCGNRVGTNCTAQPRKQPGLAYTVNSYAHAVAAVCRRAFPAPAGLDDVAVKAWQRAHHIHPHQLRHTAGTRFRRAGGLDLARALLGQKSFAAAEIYAEIDMERARKYMQRVG